MNMQTFLFILIVLCAIGALVAIVRGVILMLKANHEEVNNQGVSKSGIAQNKMMWRRIQFQFVAVALALVFLMIARGHAG